jgi:PEGA domain
MASRTDRVGQDFEDWASVHGRLLPWSDDQTTATYQPAQLRFLRRYAHAGLPRLVPPRTEPTEPTERSLVRHDDEEENPIEHARGNVGAWFRTAAATAGLFAAVLFTRVLLHTSAIEPERAPAPALPAPVRASQPAAARLQTAEPSVAVEIPQSSALGANADESKGARSSSSTPVTTRSKPTAAPSQPLSPSTATDASARSRSRASGTLRINSRPWAQVFVDGRYVGNTPQFGISVPPGKHSVRLLNPQLGMVKAISLSVGAGETVTRVEVLEQ